MHVLLLTKFFFLLVFLVMYIESEMVIPTMKPNLQELYIVPGEKLDIECSSTRKIKFFHKSIYDNKFNLSRISFFPEEKEHEIYTLKIQINGMQYPDTGSFGCGHNKRDDKDVRWIYVGIQDSYSYLHRYLQLDYGRKSYFEQYIKVKEHDVLLLKCDQSKKMIFRRYISPWLCCILPIEDKTEVNDTIMINKKDKEQSGSGIFDCDFYCEKNQVDFINGSIRQYNLQSYFKLVLRKKKAVLGDTGWYGCSSNLGNYGTFWSYIYVEPEKYLFVDIHDFKAITVDVNKTLTIPCRPKSPNYQVTLWANKTKINDNDNVIFNNSLGFIIKNVQLKDNGYYECRITLDGITQEKSFDVLVTEPNNLKPTMYPDLSYIELEENQILNLTCTSTQIRPYFLFFPWALIENINWHTHSLKEKTYEEADGIHTSKLQVKTSSRDTGFYGCVNFKLDYKNLIFKNTYLEPHIKNIRWIYVYVKAKPKIRKLRINKYYGPKEIAEIENTVVAFPSSDIRSTLEESNPHLKIQSITNPYLYDISNREFTITLFVSLSLTPARNITLTFFNDVGNDSIVVPLFQDDKPPEFGIIGPNKNVEVGKVLELTCIGSLTNSLDIMEWISDDTDIAYNSQIILAGGDPRFNIRLLEYDEICISILTISSVRKSDERKIYCKTENTMYSYMISVDELEKPNCNHTNMNETEVKYETRGKSTVLICYVNGVPEPIITWSKDNVQINTTYPDMPNDTCKYEFHNKYQELRIGYLDGSCFGNYSCKADNYLDHWETYQQIVIDDPTIRNIIAFGVTSALIITTIILIYFFIKFKKEKNLRKQLMEGDLQPLNPELTVNEQVDLLGYNKKWEFSRDKLELGKVLGRGHFGIVKKAEAYGIYGDGDETITTVAVKIAKKSSGITNIQVLANELKIMIYIGEHRNIVNLLGACTKNITKRELLVIVEYCHHGDLHDYLIKHRLKFINQINPLIGKINIAPIGFKTSTALANVKNNNNNKINYSALSFSGSRSSGLSVISDKDSIEMSNNIALNKPALYPEDCLDDYNKDQNLQTICTQDLFSWSLQVAQGMEYLSNKKVLHGDLAARNILLAQNNIVKISDFGLAKNIYTDGIYEKKGNGPLPFKWIAIDSLKNGIFTTQSDVWSFGIVLWEFFSLAETPYAGMGLDEYVSKLLQGYRMEKPEYATNEIYNIMLKCWLKEQTLRPTFTDLVNDIGDLLGNIDKKDSTDLNTPFVDIKNRLDDGANNNYLIINPTPDHSALSSSKSDYVDEPTININTNLSYVSMN